MLSVELRNLANILDSAGQSKNVSDLAREWSGRIKDAIMANTVCLFLFVMVLITDTDDHKLQGDIFAYETNGT